MLKIADFGTLSSLSRRGAKRKDLFMVLCVSVASLAFGDPQESSACPCGTGNPTLKLRHMVEPAYPEEAKENGIGGTGVVEVLIDKQGVAQDIRVVRGAQIL